MPRKPKFKIGDTVTYDRGKSAVKVRLPQVVQATVYQVDTFDDNVVYQIKWGTISKASVSERQIKKKG